MSEDIKRMDIREFREVGFLQEVNRTRHHPLPHLRGWYRQLVVCRQCQRAYPRPMFYP